jgi:hypothetical protein
MRQHRKIALFIALAAALLVPAVGASAPADQVRGAPCGDITLWDSAQSGPPAYGGTEGGAATVDALLTTAKPSCAGFVYTITLYTDTTESSTIALAVFMGDGVTSSFAWQYNFSTGAPHSVCIAATSTQNGRVVDAAPNSGCFTLTIGASGGGSGLN